MQAITTKFLGPTNYRGSRVKATAEAGSITLEWDHALNSDENHWKAAKALINRLGWAGDAYPDTWVEGGLPQNNSQAYCFVGLYSHSMRSASE